MIVYKLLANYMDAIIRIQLYFMLSFEPNIKPCVLLPINTFPHSLPPLELNMSVRPVNDLVHYTDRLGTGEIKLTFSGVSKSRTQSFGESSVDAEGLYLSCVKRMKVVVFMSMSRKAHT